MEEEEKEMGSVITTDKSLAKQRTLDEFLKRSIKESETSKTITQVRMAEEPPLQHSVSQRTEEQAHKVKVQGREKAQVGEPEEVIINKLPSSFVQTEPLIGENHQLEDVCARFLLNVAARLPRNEEMRPFSTQNHRIAERTNEIGEFEMMKEKFNRFNGHLFDHERKIDILKDVGERIINKTIELDQVKDI